MKRISSAQFIQFGLLLAAVILTVFLMTRSFVPDMTFWGEALDTSGEVGKILVAKGYCEEPKYHCGGEVYFISPLSGGFNIVTVGIDDKSVLEEINRLIAKRFDALPTIKQIHFIAYKGDGIRASSSHAPKHIGVIYDHEFKR